MLLFDTGKKLEKAFTAEQFDALVDVLDKREDKSATKEDLRETELRMQVEVEKVRTEIQGVRNELKEEIQGVRNELSNTKHEILKWVMATMVAQTALIIAVIAFLK